MKKRRYMPNLKPAIIGELGYAHIALATGFAVLFIGSGTRFVFGLALIPMSEDLQASRSELSAAAALFMLVSALAMPVVGRIIDRHSIRTVMTIGALIAAAGIASMGAAGEVWHLFPLYGGLYAVGFAATSVAPVSVLMARWFPERRGLAASAAIAGNGSGQLVIVSLLASSLPAVGWRVSYAALGAVNAALIAPLAFIVLRRSPPRRAGAERGGDGDDPTVADSPPMRRILASSGFWLLMLMFAICGAQDFFVATHIVAFAEDQDVSQRIAGGMLAFMGLSALVGVLVSGGLSDKFGARLPTLICFAIRIGLFALILIPSFQTALGIAAFALLYGFTFTMTAPLTVVFAGNMFGASRLGAVSGLISMVHQIAGGVGAFVGALIFDSTGSYDGAFTLMLAMSLAAAAVTIAIRERPTRALAAETG